MNANRLTPVMVEWQDAFAETSAWTYPSDIEDDECLVKSLGFLLPEAKAGHVVIAQSSNSSDQVDSVLAVPVAMVRRVLLLS